MHVWNVSMAPIRPHFSRLFFREFPVSLKINSCIARSPNSRQILFYSPAFNQDLDNSDESSLKGMYDVLCSAHILTRAWCLRMWVKVPPESDPRHIFTEIYVLSIDEGACMMGLQLVGFKFFLSAFQYQFFISTVFALFFTISDWDGIIL